MKGAGVIHVDPGDRDLIALLNYALISSIYRDRLMMV